MQISPQRVRSAEFDTIKRGGLDPDEVRAFLTDVAGELERAQNQATAMEARARAAVARLQELSETGGQSPVPTSEPGGDTASVTPSVDEAETISRTLLLAQRTADTTVAEAEAEANRITGEATAEATSMREAAQSEITQMLDEARAEARRAGDAEKIEVETEVNSLKARRDFLESDVDHLERHVADERSRLREAATTLLDLTERVPGGLGEVRRPLLSASDDDAGESVDDSMPAVADESDDDGDTLVIRTDIADEDTDTAR
ncbi:MAG: DivIVA domain-containing protein [Ilumatobacter sp.]